MINRLQSIAWQLDMMGTRAQASGRFAARGLAREYLLTKAGVWRAESALHRAWRQQLIWASEMPAVEL